MLESLFGKQKILIGEVHHFAEVKGCTPVMILAETEVGPVTIMAPLMKDELEKFLDKCRQGKHEIECVFDPKASHIMALVIGRLGNLTMAAAAVPKSNNQAPPVVGHG